MKKIVILVGVCVATMFTYGQQVRYVTQSGAGARNGSTWRNASDDLQEMINQSNPGDQVWVAEGRYVPFRMLNDPFGPIVDHPQCSFTFHNGVEVYGGFAGNEAQIDQRDWRKYETVLSSTDHNDNGHARCHIVCI
jgi:hypothetical protein